MRMDLKLFIDVFFLIWSDNYIKLTDTTSVRLDRLAASPIDYHVHK